MLGDGAGVGGGGVVAGVEDGEGDVGDVGVDAFEVGQDVEVNGAGFVLLFVVGLEAGEVLVAELADLEVEVVFVAEEFFGEDFVAGLEGGVGEEHVFEDFFVEVIKFFPVGAGEIDAELDFFEYEAAEVFVDDVADGFEFGEVAELAELLLDVGFVEGFGGEVGEEFFDFGVEEIDLVVAVGDFADEVFVVGFHGAPEVFEHGADDFGGVHDFAGGLGHGHGGAVEGAVLDVAWSELSTFIAGGRGDPPFDEFAEGGDEGEDEKGFEEVEAGVGVGDVVDDGAGGFGEEVDEGGGKGDDEGGGEDFGSEVGEGEAAGFELFVTDDEGGDGDADVGTADDGEGELEGEAVAVVGGGGEGDEESDGGGGGLEDHGEEGGDEGEADGVVLGDFEEFDEVGVGCAGVGGGFDDGDAEEEEAECEDDLAEAAVGASAGELEEENAEEDEDGCELFDGESDELDDEGEADVGTEHKNEHLAGGDVSLLDGLDGEHGHGGGGGCGDGGGHASEEGLEGVFGDGLEPLSEAVSEDAVEAFAEVACGEDEEGDSSEDHEHGWHVWAATSKSIRGGAVASGRG